jgi:hypothetical protein
VADFPADAAAAAVCSSPRSKSWFKPIPAERYLALYGQIRDRLFGLGDASVMLCWESAHDCHAGNKWCHRHLAVLEDCLGIEVQEVEGLDPLRKTACSYGNVSIVNARKT